MKRLLVKYSAPNDLHKYWGLSVVLTNQLYSILINNHTMLLQYAYYLCKWFSDASCFYTMQMDIPWAYKHGLTSRGAHVRPSARIRLLGQSSPVGSIVAMACIHDAVDAFDNVRDRPKNFYSIIKQKVHFAIFIK